MSFKGFLKKHKFKLLIAVGLGTWYLLCLPAQLFNNPTSTVLEDANGELLGAKIADDGQWRFPQSDSVPHKFRIALMQFEDRNFPYHPGVNPLAIGRALVQNIKAGKVVSGGSTITMQVIRLSRKGKSRTVFEKLIEVILSTRLELSLTKDQILSLYAAHAPFGGNVVGLEAAAWRYYGRGPEKLSWGETATLAVLPNAPSLIYPGKNHVKLLAKRNRLLDRLQEIGELDSMSCELAREEPLPGKPLALPQLAPHLLMRACVDGRKGQRVQSSLNAALQTEVTTIVEKHHRVLQGNEIHNAAALVLDVETGEVLAYIGNTSNPGQPEMGSDVDVITAPRSTGSIMKPFLFASMLKDGAILPNTLVADIPTQIAGYTPKNYNLQYDGAVPAHRALARSLNVPAVRMLQKYGLEKLHYLLPKLGLSTITYPANHYGLSLILGGAEATLWDLCGLYASMSRTVNHFREYNSRYDRSDFHPATYLNAKSEEREPESEPTSLLSASSIWLTYKALIEVNRPDEEGNWQEFSSSKLVAWKTGTSFGYRDGWAIGTTPTHVVGVWVGNADGEGRPGLVGVKTAAPILFDIFDLLQEEQRWFDQPYDEMTRIAVCKQSGHRALDICEPVDSMWVQNSGLITGPCTYHRLIHLDASEKFRVTSECADVKDMIHRSWFVLPPVQEWYYKSKNANYKTLPAFAPGCGNPEGEIAMDLIYPKRPTKIFVPIELDGKLGETVFEVAHRKSNTTIYWHVDATYIGSTVDIHQMGLRPDEGEHLLTLVDEHGEMLERKFEIVGRTR